MHGLVQNAHFGNFPLRTPISVIFARGTPLLSDFRQSARVCTKQTFSAQNHHVLSFSHLVHHFLTVFNKVHEFTQNREFSPRSARFVISVLGEPLFCHFYESARVCGNRLISPRSARFLILGKGCTTFVLILGKVYEFVQNSVFCPRSASFVILALGALLFSDFHQSPRVLPNSSFCPRSANLSLLH